MTLQIKKKKEKEISFICPCPMGREQNTGATLPTKESHVSGCALASKPFGLQEPYCMFGSDAKVLKRKHM